MIFILFKYLSYYVGCWKLKKTILCWNILFCFIIIIIIVSCISVHYILQLDIIIIQFCKKLFFSNYLFFTLEFRLHITANVIWLLKVNYILEKSLPVEVWVKDKPFRYFVGKIFIIIL